MLLEALACTRVGELWADQEVHAVPERSRLPVQGAALAPPHPERHAPGWHGELEPIPRLPLERRHERVPASGVQAPHAPRMAGDLTVVEQLHEGGFEGVQEYLVAKFIHRA